MPADELTLFSYEILGLVGQGGASAHDLRQMARHGRILDWAGESQYYTEPKRLAKLGYLAARREPGKTRERTVYTLTDKGLEALREAAHGLPHREKYLLIATRFLRRYLELHEQLVDEVERELSASPTPPREGRR